MWNDIPNCSRNRFLLIMDRQRPQYCHSRDWQNNGDIGKRRLRESYITKKNIFWTWISAAVFGGGRQQRGGIGGTTVIHVNANFVQHLVIGTIKQSSPGCCWRRKRHRQLSRLWRWYTICSLVTSSSQGESCLISHSTLEERWDLFNI